MLASAQDEGFTSELIGRLLAQDVKALDWTLSYLSRCPASQLTEVSLPNDPSSKVSLLKLAVFLVYGHSSMRARLSATAHPHSTHSPEERHEIVRQVQSYSPDPYHAPGLLEQDQNNIDLVSVLPWARATLNSRSAIRSWQI